VRDPSGRPPLIPALTRLHDGSSAFSDFWSQAVIDFMLGHRSMKMFTSECALLPAGGNFADCSADDKAELLQVHG
jgi:hypothetical protein